MPPRELSRGDRRCLNLLRSYLHGKSYCWVRQKVIAEKLGVDIRTVKRYYASLTAAGEISVRKRGDGQSAIVTVTSAVTSAVTSEMHQGVSQVTDVASVTSEYVTSENVHLPEENLKTGKNQSESTVQEHLEQATTAIEPSPYEKAQADAIAHSVQACVFEPTPDLIAELERKRRHYGVTGFVVASAIARAFKLVEGTSDTPQKPAWFTAVVENALKPSERDKTERRSVAGETPAAYRPKWTPRPIPAANVDQAGGAAVVTTRATEEKRRQFQSVASNAIPPTAPACLRCGSDGVVNGTVSWCDCERGREQRRARPGYVDYLIRKGWKPGAIAAAVQPRPPQREPGPLGEVATAAGGAR